MLQFKESWLGHHFEGSDIISDIHTYFRRIARVSPVPVCCLLLNRNKSNRMSSVISWCWVQILLIFVKRCSTSYAYPIISHIKCRTNRGAGWSISSLPSTCFLEEYGPLMLEQVNGPLQLDLTCDGYSIYRGGLRLGFGHFSCFWAKINWWIWRYSCCF